MLLMTKTNKICLKNLSVHDKNQIKKGLSLRNPLYHKLLRMGNVKALYNTPEFFKYYKEEKNGDLIIGRGNENRLYDYAKATGQDILIERDETVFPHLKIKVVSSIKLRPEQEDFIESLDPHKNTNGIIKCSTGFGKTILALKLFEYLQTPTLIVVPRNNILKQFIYESEKYLGFRPRVIGSEEDNDGRLTLATIQSLQRKGVETLGISKSFGCVIFDEAHLTVPEKSRRVVESFYSKHRYGFTATPKRTDEQGDALKFIFGPILIERKIATAKPSIKQIPFYGQIPILEYSKIIDHQIRNESRNDLLISTIITEARKGKKVLVLTKRIEHYELIEKGIKARSEGCGLLPIYSISSDASCAAETGLLMLRLRQSLQDFSVLLGTFSLLGTGVDIPRLDTLVLAGDLKSEVLAEQAGGRILRLFEGKPEPKIIDIQDYGNKILLLQAKARLKFYKSSQWQIL